MTLVVDLLACSRTSDSYESNHKEGELAGLSSYRNGTQTAFWLDEGV